MKRLSVIIALLAIVSCKKEVTQEPPVFYTFEALREQLKKQPNPDDIPLPHALHKYYSIHNFIVDSIGNLYYFHHNEPFIPGCGTGLTEEIYPAKFINLKPEQVVKIPSAEIELFIKRKILNDTIYGGQKILFIGSEKDTIHSKNLLKLADVFNAKEDQTLILRRITQEESEVLTHKKRNIPYDYHLIKWDSVRTTFKKHY